MPNIEVLTIEGIECYEQDNVCYLRLEAVARGLGFVQEKNGVEYVRWDRVEGYLEEFGFPHKWGKGDFIPENIFYRLAMKAKNEVAEQFQAKIADEVIPSIRKTGGYIQGQENMTAEELMAKALVVAQKTLAEREARISALTVDLEIAKPKAEYFDQLVDRNLLTGIRETAKEIGTPPKSFVKFLLDKKYLYRDRKGKLMPYQPHVDSGLFELKECINEKTQWGGTQTMVTPKGREAFRLLYPGA